MRRLLMASWLGLALSLVGVQGAGRVSAADQQRDHPMKPSLSLTVVAGTTGLTDVPILCEYHNILSVTGSGLMPHSFISQYLNGQAWDPSAFGPVSDNGTYDNHGNSGAYGLVCDEPGMPVSVMGIAAEGSASGKAHRSVTATATHPLARRLGHSRTPGRCA
jgi:hypothetical protein